MTDEETEAQKGEGLGAGMGRSLCLGSSGLALQRPAWRVFIVPLIYINTGPAQAFAASGSEDGFEPSRGLWNQSSHPQGGENAASHLSLHSRGSCWALHLENLWQPGLGLGRPLASLSGVCCYTSLPSSSAGRLWFRHEIKYIGCVALGKPGPSLSLSLLICRMGIIPNQLLSGAEHSMLVSWESLCTLLTSLPASSPQSLEGSGVSSPFDR